MKEFSKWAMLFIISVVMGLYTAFVIKCYWSWFAVPALNLPEVSFFQILGLIWLLQLVMGNESEEAEDTKFKMLANAIELCVPAEKQSQLTAMLEEEQVMIRWKALGMISRRFGSNTFMLILGFALSWLT
jgi:hypothetical protein